MDGSDLSPNPAKHQREQRAADLQGRYVIPKTYFLMRGSQAATGCGEEAHSYQKYISPNDSI